MPDEQRAREAEAGKIIWAAASLHAGAPGHVTRVTLLIAQMVRLLREAEAGSADAPEPAEELPGTATGRLNAPEPPAFQQLLPPGISEEDRRRLLEKYAPDGRHHA
jgi:hypothetical protein